MNDKEQEAAREREHMYRCLVRWVITKRIQDRAGAIDWLSGYRDHNWKHHKGWNELHPKSRLEADVKDQWNKGNRGNEGEWK